MRKCWAILFAILCLALSSALAEDVPETVLFSGSASSGGQPGYITAVFTSHVGGDWDAAQINEGCSFQVTFSGPKQGIYLALSSHSGATWWARIPSSEVEELGEDRWVAHFRYEDIARGWGTNFARLDQVSVYSSTDQPTTVTRIAYMPGEGAPVDDSDGCWDKPDTGIAFIGDSICQNAMLLHGDWNTLLGRGDCANYGIGGQTSRQCAARIGELCGRDYHHVVIICGINDIGYGGSGAEIAANHQAMIEALEAANPDIQVILVSVLPTTEAFFYGMQHRIVELNTALEQLAEQDEHVTFVSCYGDFFDEERGYARPELLSDGLHPNAEGYAIIAERLTGVLPPEED